MRYHRFLYPLSRNCLLPRRLPQAGRPADAMSVLQRMSADGVAADTVTYNAAVTACRANAEGLWKEARVVPVALCSAAERRLRRAPIFRLSCRRCAAAAALSRGAPCHNSTQISLLPTAQKTPPADYPLPSQPLPIPYSPPTQAVRLLDRASKANLSDVVTHNAALSVLERAGRWEEALALFSSMRRGGSGISSGRKETSAGPGGAAGKEGKPPPAPNSVSVATVVTALATAKEAKRAVALLEEMARRHPNAPHPTTTLSRFLCDTCAASRNAQFRGFFTLLNRQFSSSWATDKTGRRSSGLFSCGVNPCPLPTPPQAAAQAADPDPASPPLLSAAAFNAAISACERSSPPDAPAALALLQRMASGAFCGAPCPAPDAVSVRAAIFACCAAGGTHLADALKLFKRARAPRCVVLSVVLVLC